MSLRFVAEHRRAVTLLELIVAFSLLLLLFGLVFSFLVPSLRAQARGTARAGMQQEGVVVLNRLEVELQDGAAPGVSLVAASGRYPVHFCIHPLVGLSSEGVQQWASEITVYSWDADQDQLTRSVWQSPLPGGRELLTLQPTHLSAADFAAIVAAPDNGTRRTVARDVSDFRFEHQEGTKPFIVQPVIVTLELEREVPGRSDPEQVVLTRTMGLRNGL